MFFKDLKDLMAGNANAETGKSWTLMNREKIIFLLQSNP
jgi:hypothetical protein